MDSGLSRKDGAAKLGAGMTARNGDAKSISPKAIKVILREAFLLKIYFLNLLFTIAVKSNKKI